MASEEVPASVSQTDNAIAQSIATAMGKDGAAVSSGEDKTSGARRARRGRRFGHSIRLFGGGVNFLTMAAMGLGAAGLAGVLPPVGPEVLKSTDASLAMLPSSTPASNPAPVVGNSGSWPGDRDSAAPASTAARDAAVSADAPKPVSAPATMAPQAISTDSRKTVAAQADVTKTAPASEASNDVPAVLRSESESIARFDQFIAPVRDMAPSVEDAVRIRDAFASGGNVAKMRELRSEITDPLGKKLVEWQLLRNGAGSAREIRAFAEANPDWPNRDLMFQRAEEQLFASGGAASDIKGFFKGGEPKTSMGEAALASAYLVENNEAEAAKLASKVWREGDIPSSLETGFIERFGKLLKEADHKWRLDRFLADDGRYDTERRDRAAVIRRVIPFLSPAEQAKAQARLAVFMRTADADKLLGALPADAATQPVADWGLALQLSQWHRRAGRVKDAAAILKDAPVETDKIVSPDDWWEERRVTAYELLKTGDYETAYEIVRAPGELSVNPRKDATFLAGWIALKHLGKADEAIKHFRELEAAADGPLSRGKAGFWLARAYERLGQKDKAAEALAFAAKNSDTFYGMMAQQMIEPGRSRITISPPRSPSEQEGQAFVERDAVKAVVLARKSGVDQNITRVFLTHLRNTAKTEPELALLAHLAEALGDTQMAVRIGKSGIARGMNLVTYAYPLHAMPLYQPLRPPPEQAVLLGVARQESEFNTATTSGAGARGLLQVMPVTAQHVCKDYKIKCEIDRLGRDPAYNLMMASAYIGDRMDEFNGSYVLTLAGYNAGPGRTRQWIREFGDPRDPAVDPIDWVHRIPFEETREYVLKVLSNIQMYRARLGDEANALKLASDLRRTGNLKRAAAAAGSN